MRTHYEQLHPIIRKKSLNDYAEKMQSYKISTTIEAAPHSRICGNHPTFSLPDSERESSRMQKRFRFGLVLLSP